MRITIATLFKEQFNGFVTTSIIKRAINKGLVNIDVVDIRDYSLDKHRKVDDKPYGGGAGLVMRAQPIIDCILANKTDDSHVILMAPAGKVYSQKIATQLSEYKHLILICGHYEGVDFRIMPYIDEVISIGDYVLTGGELASMVVCDSVIRLLDNVINHDSLASESFEIGLLEHPHYTTPAIYNGVSVPEVLLSGHHANIEKYRHQQSLLMTKKYRPDLLDKYQLSADDIEFLKNV